MKATTTIGYLLGGIILGMAIIEVQPRCIWGDMRFPHNKEFSPLPACGKCRCISDGNDEFKWSCPDNIACEKRPIILVCSYKGERVHAGLTIPHNDGCNNCTCNIGGNLTCTNVTCPATPPTPALNPPIKCYYKGKVLRVGEEFFPDSSQKWKRCSCTKTGRVTCPDSCAKCVYNGTELTLGAVVPSLDGCNTCVCGEEAMVSCTERFCGPTQCFYKGQWYDIGVVFQKAKGDCNTCDCGIDGEVECSSTKCTPIVPDSAAAVPPGEAKRNQTCLFKGKHYEIGQVWEWSEGARVGPQGVERECDTCRCVVYPEDNEMHVRWVCTSTCVSPTEPTHQQMPIWKMFARLLDGIFSRSPRH